MAEFSAKDLVTRSCMQIKMFAEHPECRTVSPTQGMLYGEKFQKAVANTIPGIIGEEMKGDFQAGGIIINFSNDILCHDKVIEVKSVRQPIESWYRNSSILQCAFYKSMIMLGANHLATASFYANLGHERHAAWVDPNIRYVLIFGEEKYEINVIDPNTIADFFVSKASSTLDWTSAKAFDAKYKRREWELLQRNIIYKPIF